MNIAVAGAGYVGLSLLTLLSQHSTVTVVGIVEARINMLNFWKSLSLS